MTTPFNPAAHEFLIANGYTHAHYEATWEDDGDAENGPCLSGGPAYDEYTSDEDYVFVGEDGDTGTQPRDKAFEEWCDKNANAGVFGDRIPE